MFACGHKLLACAEATIPSLPRYHFELTVAMLLLATHVPVFALYLYGAQTKVGLTMNCLMQHSWLDYVPRMPDEFSLAPNKSEEVLGCMVS